MRNNTKVGIVIGAGRGINKALAIHLSKKNYHLTIVSKTQNIYDTLSEIEKKKNIIPLMGNIADKHFVYEVIAKTIDTWGKIDFLINGAAILGPNGMIADCDSIEWAETLNVNLLGTVYSMQAVIPHMIKQQKGKIVNYAGGGAAYAYPNFSAYAAAKVAVVRLTETVAEELRTYGINVNVIAPGAVETDLLAQVKDKGGYVKTTVDINEPIKLIDFLISEKSNSISGLFIHSRDNYENFGENFSDDFLKLRRIEK